MRIQFVSNNFPPEVNAPATRLIEHARQWIRDGYTLEVLTSVPNFPEGRIYEGYKNQYSTETTEGIDVTRVPMFVTANEGVLKRTLSYLSYMFSAWFFAGRSQRPDIVVATSPQFFAAVAGYWIARRWDVPFVLEIRDLWPESIVAVGAVKHNWMIRLFERLEHFLYRKADHIVVVTDAFKSVISKKGIDPDKISVVKNGADLEAWDAPLDPGKLDSLREKHGLQNAFVVSYIGTIGMAHRADVLLEAAQKCIDPNVVFMIVGTGAEYARIAARQAELNLPNFRLVGKVPKEEVRYMLALTDASLVHLKASPLFKTVIPSKIFESMVTKTPIILGVEGEAREIVEEASAGIPIEPENVDQLVDAVLELKNRVDVYERMAENGYRFVRAYYDRAQLAREYTSILRQVLEPQPTAVEAL